MMTTNDLSGKNSTSFVLKLIFVAHPNCTKTKYSDNIIGILHNESTTLDGVDVYNLTGSALYDQADLLYDKYWRSTFLNG